MNVRRVEIEKQSYETPFQAGLASQCKLTPEEMRLIAAYARDSSITLAQSALRLGFATQADIDVIMAGLQQMDPDEKEGLVEAAINKISEQQQRREVVHVADTVKPSARLVLAHDPYNPRSELIRALRTELLLRNETGQSNIVCVVSSCSNEGRSQLCAELAIAFSQLGRRTLLVDADLRHPQQHQLFSANNDRGLCDALLRDDRPHVLNVEGLPHLSLLTTGVLPPNPLELLSSGRFERLLREWKKSFEFVVIDTPPVTHCADALAIATLARRVLFVVRAEHTRYKDTNETLRRLATTRAQILGAAMNHF